MLNVVVLASGGGGNLRAVVEHPNHTKLYQVTRVLTDRICGAINVAKDLNLEHIRIDSSQIEQYFTLIPSDTDLIVLAGYMPIIQSQVCKVYSGRMINTHPSLLPKFGGRGMYGVKVHQAVLAAKESITGCTVHFVSEGIDEGSVIMQKKIVIPPGIDAWSLGGLVFELETQLLPEVIYRFAIGQIP